MSNNFDNLSDDFLNEDDNSGKEPRKHKGPTIRKGKTIRLESEEGKPIDLDNLPIDLPPEIRSIIKSISDIKERGGNVEEELNLGEPDEHETRDEDGNTMDKSTWNTDFGSVTRISIDGEIPSGLDGESIRDLFRNKFGFGTYGGTKELSLEEKLDIALEEEDYLEAAKLRDEIEGSTVKKGEKKLNWLEETLKELKKDDKSENSGNTDTEGDSEGSFWDLLD